MGLIHSFNKSLEIWLARQGISNIEVGEGAEYTYRYERHKIEWGLISNEKVEHDFGQFFYEYGITGVTLDRVNILVLSFLHEVGHVMTFFNFDENERELDNSAKEVIDNNFDYWDLPTEFAANIWTINWVEDHAAAYNELLEMFKACFIAISEDEDIVAQIYDWMDEVMIDPELELIIVEGDE